MPDITECVKQLNELKGQSMEKYNEAMKGYQENYPDFYNQLLAAMKESSTQATSTKFKDFVKLYKWYLLAIGVGIGIIVYLVMLILSR